MSAAPLTLKSEYKPCLVTRASHQNVAFIKKLFFNVSACLCNDDHTYLNREGQFILFLDVCRCVNNHNDPSFDSGHIPDQISLQPKETDELHFRKTGNR